MNCFTHSTFKMTQKLLLTLIIIFTVQTQAQTLTTTIGSKTYKTHGLADETSFTFDKLNYKLKPVSHGLREKKVFALIPVKVYYVELLASQPQNLIKTEGEFLTSLPKAQAVQLRLTLLRNLTGKQISDSFKEALEKNDIKIDSAPEDIKQMMSEVAKIEKFSEGEVFSIFATFNDTSSDLYLQKPDQSIITIKGRKEFAQDIFKIWFGHPVDEKLTQLKKELLK